MKILIINLPRYKGSSVTREIRCELIMNYRVDTPSSLLIIVSMLREKNYQVEFIDANGLNLNYNFLSKKLNFKQFDIVFFFFVSKIINDELKFCDLVKKYNSSTITIGFSWYARNFGKEILQEYTNLDILIIKEPFSVIENLIDCIKDKCNIANVGGIAFRDKENQIFINKKLNYHKKFNELPLPAYDMLKTFKPYYIYSPFLRPFALVHAGKGCPYGCCYCPVSKTKYSGRSAKDIIKELQLLKKLGKIKYVWFFDEIFTINRKRIIEVCRGIIKEKLKIKWLCDSRVDLIDLSLLKLMKKAGCMGISYGVESGSQKILDLMNKGTKVSQGLNALKWARKAHILTQLNLILGYIGETKYTLKETENFIRKTLPDIMQINLIMAFTETKFMEIVIKNKCIDDNLNWKTNLTCYYDQIKNYSPDNLNLHKVKLNLNKMLHRCPAWWFNLLKTLIWNSKLILFSVGLIIWKSDSIKIQV